MNLLKFCIFWKFHDTWESWIQHKEGNKNVTRAHLWTLHTDSMYYERWIITAFVKRMWHTLQRVIMNHSSNMRPSLALRHDVIQFSSSMVNSIWYMSVFIWVGLRTKDWHLNWRFVLWVQLHWSLKKKSVFEHVLCKTREGKWRLLHLTDIDLCRNN